ncbi:MAG: hypothetical protein HXY34_07940 [Candidatus Thorarchaeota archaeon]|nr:hypothetical protein [Candidatus Thorarchaeota archaeon]
MIAAALEKLAQTARNYKQTYHKTTDVGGGNRIDFERAEDGTITIAGDKQKYHLTEQEVRQLAESLKNLPPVEIAPSSDYVQKTQPQGNLCIVVKNGGKSALVKVTEAALLKTEILSSMESRFFQEHMDIDGRRISINRTSDLKWSLSIDGNQINFTAYEIEALVAGLHNSVLEVLMDLVKSTGSDDVADIRVKSYIQRIEQDVTKIVADHKTGKDVVKAIVASARKIVASTADADTRTEEFIEMCKYVYSRVDRSFVDAILGFLAKVFVVNSG